MFVIANSTRWQRVAYRVSRLPGCRKFGLRWLARTLTDAQRRALYIEFTNGGTR